MRLVWRIKVFVVFTKKNDFIAFENTIVFGKMMISLYFYRLDDSNRFGIIENLAN
jgi:hypothetical protein